MCVAAIAWLAHPRWRLVAIANRDEFHARPTAALARWDNGILAGRDLEAGGTWLGASESGRFALVTNYRVEGFPKPGLASRGGVVTGWLDHGELPGGTAMNPFHLIACDEAQAWHVTNQPAPLCQVLSRGLHGVSNGAFDTPWPKTARLKAALSDWLGGPAEDPAPLYAALADETRLPAEPDSEGPLAEFSPVFIRSPVYGTRASSVVLIAQGGTGLIGERRLDEMGEETGFTEIAFGP